MTKAFISYSHIDREFVKRLVRDLEARLPNLKIWYDMLLQAGASWADTLLKEIESADVILAILSPDYLASSWGMKELEVAMLRRTEADLRLIPILIRPCKPSGLLAALSWVDFTTDYNTALERLVWGITRERPPAAAGIAPGEASESIEPNELAKLRNELKEAVNLFKARTEQISTDGQPHVDDIDEKGKCFVVMPFNDLDLEVVYEDFVKPVIENECGLVCERGDDVFGSNIIMDDILKSIRSAKIILADLTRKNANVFYEVGICHAFNKAVLLLSQSIDDVPFDLRHRRVLLYDYSPRGCKRLESKLKENIFAVLSSDHQER